MSEPFSRVAAHFRLGGIHLSKGDLPQAIVTLERGLELCRESNIAMYLHRLLAALGYGYALSGRISEGMALLEEATTLARSRKIRFWVARSLAWLGEAFLLAGRTDDASPTAERALRMARDFERGNEGWALRLLGEIAARAEPPDVATAEAHYRQALALAGELGMRPLVAHCHLGLGTLYRRTGKSQQAREHLTTAAAMYREMDMPFWLEKAEAELGALA